MAELIILHSPSRPILQLVLHSSETQETDFHGSGHLVLCLLDGFTQQEVLAGDEKVEEKQFQDSIAPSAPMHSCVSDYSSCPRALSQYSPDQVLMAPPIAVSGLGELSLPTTARSWVHRVLFGSLAGLCLVA